MLPHKRFDFQMGIHGASIVAIKSRLSTACLSNQEVDTAIGQLKAELDALALRMKAAISDEARKPLFGA